MSIRKYYIKNIVIFLKNTQIFIFDNHNMMNLIWKFRISKGRSAAKTSKYYRNEDFEQLLEFEGRTFKRIKEDILEHVFEFLYLKELSFFYIFNFGGDILKIFNILGNN